MFNKARKKIQVFSVNEKGAVLSLALIFLAVGVVLIVPLLSFMASSYTTTDRVYDEKASELYAADAGIREAIWNLKYNYYSLPQSESEGPFPVKLNINNKEVDANISFVSKNLNADNTKCAIFYKIESNADGVDTNSTRITSYAVIPFSINNLIFKNALASGSGITFNKDSMVIKGPLAYKTGSLSNENDKEYVFYDSDGDGVKEDLPECDPDLEFPQQKEYLAFANGFKTRAMAGNVYEGNKTTFLGENLGPIYINGNLTLSGDITLSDPVYVTGDLSTTKDLTITLNGSDGAIIVEHGIKMEKSIFLNSPNPDARLILMSVHGDINFKKENNVLHGLVYAPEGSITVNKAFKITGSIIAANGFTADKELEVAYMDYFVDTIVPGWVPDSPQIQTWEIQ